MVEEHLAEGGGSKVDYAVLVNDELAGFCEAKSPAVMKSVLSSIPPHGFQLKWVHGQPLVPKILSNVSTLFLLVTALVLRRNV